MKRISSISEDFLLESCRLSEIDDFIYISYRLREKGKTNGFTHARAEFEKNNLEVYTVKEYIEKPHEQRANLKIKNAYNSLEIDYDGRTEDFLLIINNESFNFNKRMNRSNYVFVFGEYKVPINFDSTKELMSRLIKSIFEDDVSLEDIKKESDNI